MTITKTLLETLKKSKTPEEFYLSLLLDIMEPMGAHTACIKLLRHGRIVFEYTYGEKQGPLINAYGTLEGAILRKLKQGGVFNLENYDYLDESQPDGGRMDLVVYPLAIADELLGVLIIGRGPGASTNKEKMEPMDVQTNIIAPLLALCIDSFHRSQLNSEARERIEAVEKMRLDFITSISHALRTPLTTIKGLFSAFMDPGSEIDAQTRERHRTILSEQIDKLSHFVEDLGNLMEIERGQKIEINIRGVDIAGMIRDLVTMKRQVTDRFIYEVEPESGELMVPADEEKLLRIMVKLLDNAEKYSPRGGTIHVECQDNPNEVTIIVQDWGEGMDTEEVSRIFSKFYRPPADSGPDRGGVGISLYLVKKFVEAHYGIIWIESMKSKGTKITVKLPKTVV